MENGGNDYPFELLTALIDRVSPYNSHIPIPFDTGDVLACGVYTSPLMSRVVARGY